VSAVFLISVRPASDFSLRTIAQYCSLPFGLFVYVINEIHWYVEFKKQYYSNLVLSSDNSRRLWQTINKLLHRNSSLPLPTCTSASALADSLAAFFTDKKYLNFVFLWPIVLPHHLRIHLFLRKHPLTSPLLSLLRKLKNKILYNCPKKQCDSDPIPTWLLKECSALLVPTITNIVNLSLSSGNSQRTLKEFVISPLLKKCTLDKDELSNYRPISNLPFISQIIKRVLNLVSLITLHLTTWLILTSLFTVNITPLKPLSYT